MSVFAVIPVLDEAETIASVLAAIPSTVDGVVVVDGGSRDTTVACACAAGAVVIEERRPGYGRACEAGARHAADAGATVIAFLDAGGRAAPEDLELVLAPILEGRADLVLGDRTARAEPGALRPLQRWGNRLATVLIRMRWGHAFADLGSMRAITTAAWQRLQLIEPAHGWPVQMQVRALQVGLRVEEVSIRYRRRQGGRSKVSGRIRGSLRAGAAILRVVLGA